MPDGRVLSSIMGFGGVGRIQGGQTDINYVASGGAHPAAKFDSPDYGVDRHVQSVGKEFTPTEFIDCAEAGHSTVVLRGQPEDYFISVPDSIVEYKEAGKMKHPDKNQYGTVMQMEDVTSGQGY